MEQTSAYGNSDGDYDTVVAQFREISEVPGYKLRKPIEVALDELFDGKHYRAVHILPSLDSKSGEPIEGIGRTEEEAGDSLVEILTGIYSGLQRFEAEGKKLLPELRLQKTYLDTLMVRVE
ncbi:MAG TPA: hypothetical protein VJH95_01335 [Candidatus Nanoarchaeia archaeon]|nr:hypothetical protein [Candidatus Nanoarchaeia archaeon]